MPTLNNINSADQTKTANTFASYFSQAVSKIKSLAIPMVHFAWRKPRGLFRRTNETFKLSYVSRIFVERELKQLNRNKSAGLDNLPPGMLKDCAKNISRPLRYIINLSITSSIVPNTWKNAKIAAVYKSGVKNDPGNYRPMSVLPILSKIL